MWQLRAYSGILLATICWLYSGMSLASSNQAKPVLKAIDPTQAKYDRKLVTPAPSPNPLNAVQGKPISQQSKRSNQTQTGYEYGQSAPDRPGQPYSSAQRNDFEQPYSSEGGDYSGQTYPSARPNDSRQDNSSAQSDYSGQPYSANQPDYLMPPGSNASSPTSMRGQSSGYSNDNTDYRQQPPAYARRDKIFPDENMIPEFGQPLPAVPNTPYAQSSPPQGFTTYRAPDSQAPSTPLTRSSPDLSYQNPSTNLEPRIIHLEQIAFGSTYPEHELEDRVDHLENEVFGKSNEGNFALRIAKLESKLLGKGAFGQADQQPRSPVVTTAYGPDTIASNQSIHTGRISPPNVTNNGSSYPTATTTQERSSTKISSRSNNASNQIFQAAQESAGGIPAATNSTISGTMPSYDIRTIIDSLPVDKRAGDYFAQIRRGPNGSVARWKQFPVRVHLPIGTPQSWQSGLDSGLKKWGQYLPITSVAPNAAADIEVVWINHLPPNELGITRILVQQGVMQCVIYLLRPTYYLPDIPERALSGVFLHEMGHAVGILGHSDFKDDLMVPIQLTMAGRTKNPSSKFHFANITPRDINTLKHIYESPALPDNFSSPQPADWSCQAR